MKIFLQKPRALAGCLIGMSILAVSLNPAWAREESYPIPAASGTWKNLTWEGETAAGYGDPKDGSGLELKLNGKKGRTSFYTPFVVLNPKKEYLASLEYKSDFETEMGWALSSAPGCGAPAIRLDFHVKGDGEWHKIEFPIYPVGMSDTHSIAEFLLERQAPEGAVIQLRDISVRSVEPADISASLKSPGSRQIFEGMPDQSVILDLYSKNKRAEFQVAIIDANQKVIWEGKKSVEGSVSFPVDFAKHPAGDYQIKITSGSALTQTVTVQKLPPVAHSVIIQGQVPYVDKKPFLTIGIYHCSDEVLKITSQASEGGVGGEVYTREKMFEELKKRGFNTVIHGWSVGTPDYHDMAKDYGFMVVNEVGAAKPDALPAEARNHPSFFGYYVIDEPTASKRQELVDTYTSYKEYDPYHPVMSAFANGGVGYGNSRVVDIALPDLYPIMDARSSMAGSAEYVMNCNNVLNHNDPSTCVIPVVQLYTMNMGRFSGWEPTYDQVRSEVYVDICSGAKGVMYYGFYTHEDLKDGMALNPKRKHWFLPESKLWGQIGTLNKELIEQEQFILFGQVNPEVKFAGQDQIMGSCRTIPDGKTIVMVVNPLAESGTVSITGLPEGAKLTGLLSDSPPASLRNTQASVTLPPYGVGVFEIGR